MVDAGERIAAMERLEEMRTWRINFCLEMEEARRWRWHPEIFERKRASARGCIDEHRKFATVTLRLRGQLSLPLTRVAA